MPLKKKLLYQSNLAIAYYIVGEFTESLKIADQIVSAVENLETKSSNALAMDRPAQIFNNLAIFYMMKGGEMTQKANQLFMATEKSARQVKHTTHRSLLTILNNLMIFHYNQKNQEFQKIADELHQNIKQSQLKKPLYLINVAALSYKTGDYETVKKILEALKKMVESDEGIHYFDLDNLKRIFLLSSLNFVRLKKYQEFEKDMANYKSLLPPPEDDPLQIAKAERMHAIALIKFGQVEKAKKILENY